MKLSFNGGGNIDEALQEAAAATDGFTGADLQAAVYSAKLSAVKQRVSSAEKSSGKYTTHSTSCENMPI